MAASPGAAAPLADSDVFDESEVQAALDEIASDIGCTLNLEQPIDPEQDVLFSVSGEPRDEVSDCASQDGWTWADEARTQIQLCGQACSDYQSSGEALLDYDCSL